MLTIFTPTYNRAYVLERLYLSLCGQTSKKFEWLIVDDGSTDDTKDKILEWQKQKNIKIRYCYQENAGKSMAHNRGIELTHTELFVCVDSDDYIISNAVEVILNAWESVDEEDIIGLLAFRGTENGKPITVYNNTEVKSNSLKAFYDKGIISGDTMLIYNTQIMKKYRFPQFKNEKFVPEAYLYDLLDKEGRLLLLPHVLYICEYLEDGYTCNMEKLIANNPLGYFAWIEQRLRGDLLFKHKVMDTIRYIAIAILIRRKRIVRNAVFPGYTFICYPMGYVLYRKKYKKYE